MAGGELLGDGQIGVERGQVAVVDADQLHTVQGQNPVELRRVMHFHQGGQSKTAGHLEQVGHVLVAEDRRDQQGGVGPGRPGLVELVGAEDEVLAEQGQVHHLAHLHQHLEAALEKRLVGEHRQTAGATGGIGTGDGLGVEILPDHPLAGAGLLHLGDHRRLAAAGAQGREEIAGGGQLGHLLLQLLEAQALPGGGHLPVLLPHDPLEDGARLALLMRDGVFQVRHLHGWIRGPAADLQRVGGKRGLA